MVRPKEKHNLLQNEIIYKEDKTLSQNKHDARTTFSML